jgi:hypothetical protein
VRRNAHRATPDLGRSGWCGPQGSRYPRCRGFGLGATPAGFGEPEAVLGDPHSCRNRRAARGPAAPGEQPVKRSDLARGKRANACRKRTSGGKAGGSVAAPRTFLRASKGTEACETRRWKALRARKAATLACRLWNGSLVPSQARPATEGWVGRAARQGASGVWSATSCKAEQAEREERRAERNSPGRGPGGGRLRHGLQLARAVPSAAPLEVERPPWSFGASVYGKDRSRAGEASRRKGAAPEAAAGRVRALRSGAWVPQGAREN